MLSPAEIRSAADALQGAYASAVPIAPLSRSFPGLDVEDAYAIQSLQVVDWARAGRAVRGYKVGLTSAAMQAQLGVDQPDYGFLLDGMYFPVGSTVDASRFISPRIEPEIAVVLASPLRGPGLTLTEVASAIGTVVGALEIIDSRIADWAITLPDTIADNASSAGVVVGETQLPLEAVDVVSLGVQFSINDQAAGQGTGAAVLGSPLNAVLWLANRLGELGVELAAGAVVLPGSVCAAAPIAAGDRVVADFGPLGTVGITVKE
ncbi:2-keto-4-pentenoate hydratase [Lysinimonas soli]|uniref:2-keto-4-pentenoate hydratase n=1 Tax=Lysinimonas soli TaxID=1074233 RepID=A0ABW0NRC2_9MICO